ncbi:hypothetical protein L208DRAFT_1135283, partial [Tricholoma matsutake]
PPPGEEGFDISHEDGEYKVFDDLVDGLAQCNGFTLSSCQIDHCDRRDRVEIQTAHWNIQMTNLVDAYLDFHCCDAGEGMPDIPSHLNDTSSPPIIIDVLDIFFHRQSMFPVFPRDMYPNETLV